MLRFGLNAFKKPTKVKSNTGSSLGIMAVRVAAIILDDKTHPDLFKQYGHWDSIGTILYQSVTEPQNLDIKFLNIARPLIPNLLHYPLINEIVYVINLPTIQTQFGTANEILYYFNPINIWNSVHQNANPDTVWKSTLPSSQQKTYEQVEGGNTNKVTDTTTKVFLGQTFNEKGNIKNLLPYEGDIMLEGRWGNSIRFGSTVNNAQIPNNWSNFGDNGTPITIIRNGQWEDDNLVTNPFIPITEDINQDSSSIYLTSNQQIPIEAASSDYSSYTDYMPINPNQYVGEQVIINSGRLLFNSKNDHILLSSNKTINFNSQRGFNFDTPANFVVKVGTTIKLGDKNADEPILLGNKTVTLLNKLLDKLSVLTGPSAMQTPAMSPVGPAINVVTIAAAADLNTTVVQLKNELDTLKSKTSFTK